MAPFKVATPCSYPLCRFPAVRGGRCAAHARVYEAGRRARASLSRERYEVTHERPTSAERYGSDWPRVRAAFIAEHPRCEWEGCARASVDVHHLMGVEGGNGADNLRALCRAHHNRLTRNRR